MSEAKHTPGPWKARDTRNEDGGIWIDCYAFANNGRSLGGTLAMALDSGTGKGTPEANARLIAAAPDLLEALKVLHAAYDAPESCAECNPENNVYCKSHDVALDAAWIKAQNTIVKAEGPK